jgi:hypothetical protein
VSKRNAANWILRMLAALCACATLFAQRDARACSVCLAGDPNFSANGTSAQPAGTVSVYFEVRGWTKESGSVVEDVADPGGTEPAEPPLEVAPPAAPARLAPNAPAAQPRPATQKRVPATTARPGLKLQRGAFDAAQGHVGHDHGEDDDLGLPVPASDATDGGADAGSSDHEHGTSTQERNDSQRLDLYVAWTPIDRVTLTLGVPWAFNEVEEKDSEGKTNYSLSGLGDVSLGASGVVWRNRAVLPSTWLELRGWVKAPTGRSSKQVDGVLDPHVQPGTGSWDGGAGAALVHRFDGGSLYASSFYRINSEGGLDYQYGDVVLATVALEAPLGHLLGSPALDRVTPGFGFDFRFAQRDESGGETVADTGGSVLYASPSLRVALPAFRATQRAWLRGGVQIPLTNDWLYGEQDEGVVWSVGIGYGF